MGEEGLSHHVYLLRHTKSSWDDPGLADHDRPLAPRGLKANARLREHLRATGLAPDVVLCSSAVRAVQTLEGVREGLPPATPVEIDHSVYGADAAGLLGRLKALPEAVESVLIVAHNPGIEDLALRLTEADEGEMRARMATKYPTGGLAGLLFDGSWRDLGWGFARLESFVVPKQLG